MKLKLLYDSKKRINVTMFVSALAISQCLILCGLSSAYHITVGSRGCHYRLAFHCWFILRDGPLEKLLGGQGNFRAAGIFFRYEIPCMNFFRP